MTEHPWTSGVLLWLAPGQECLLNMRKVQDTTPELVCEEALANWENRDCKGNKNQLVPTLDSGRNSPSQAFNHQAGARGSQRNHQRVRHQWRGMTFNKLRSCGLWIIGGSSAVANHISNCVTCCKLHGVVQEQKMADLPEDRLEPGVNSIKKYKHTLHAGLTGSDFRPFRIWRRREAFVIQMRTLICHSFAVNCG